MIHTLKNLVTRDSDSESVKIDKSILMFAVFFKSMGCIAWTVMYYCLGFTVAYKFPLFYFFVLVGATYFLYKTQRFDAALYLYIFFILIIPFLLQVSMGGFLNSGAVILWSMLAPMGALFFKGPKHGVFWFLAFLFLCAVSVILPNVFGGAVKLSPLMVNLMFLMNIGVVCGFLFYTFVYFKQLTTRQNDQLKTNIKDIEQQKNTIVENQRQITDSINYAKRIQHAILPPLEQIKSHLPESFVLYKPKDIVAGDFYWFNEANGKILIAAADCTGHGVPGALTSMLCSEKLDAALKLNSQPGKLLSLVNEAVKESFKHSEAAVSGENEQIQDGMDIALCQIDTVTREVIYSGAHRPLWIVRKDAADLEEIKATKTSIGGYTPSGQVYTEHTFSLQKGDTIYLFTDGYADQDGGEKGKKLMTKRFKQMILEITKEEMYKQEELLSNQIESWKGTREQLDDILVIGARL